VSLYDSAVNLSLLLASKLTTEATHCQLRTLRLACFNLGAVGMALVQLEIKAILANDPPDALRRMRGWPMLMHAINSVKPMETLPDFCYATLNGETRILRVDKGILGFRYTDFAKNTERCRRMNEALGVLPSQVMAMLCGSMFGWGTPGANPARYADVNNELVYAE